LVSRYVERTYAYEFADRTAPFWDTPASFPYLAAHTAEIQYLFPLYHGARGTPHPLSAAQERLSDQMVDYWTTFARIGKPNFPPEPPYSPPFWPRYTEERDDFQSLRLGNPVTISTYDAEHRCAFWESLLSLPH
jgi:para-nitrobenzyl esterase